MKRAIRVGAVNYLNTKPLIFDLEELAPEAELILDLPSRLADRLAQGSLDVALIPIIEYFRSGYASAVTVVFLLFVLALSALKVFVLDRRVHYT